MDPSPLLLVIDLLLLLLMFTSQCSRTAPVFLVHPVSINTTEGRVVEFTCVANNNPTTLGFVVNEGAVDPSKGFDEQNTVPLGGGNVSRTLLVTASVDGNDNSTIRCQAVGAGFPPPVAVSDIVILRVQGPLSSVVDLSYSFFNSSTINISWSPPFTLPGTDITGYNISATSNGTTTNYFTSNSYYELSLTDITDSPCEIITISVSGYNGVNGENTTTRAPSSMVDLPVILFIDNKYLLSIVINDTQLCSGSGNESYLLPESLNITLISNNTIIKKISIVPEHIIDGDEGGFDGFHVEEDHMYTIVISFELFDGAYQYTDSIDIDTYDLVSANLLNSSDSRVCLECSFSSFSNDTNCTVKLSSIDNNERHTLTLQRENTNIDTAIECFSAPVDTGEFVLHVFEQGNSIHRFSIGTITFTKPSSTPTSTHPHQPSFTGSISPATTGPSTHSITSTSTVTILPTSTTSPNNSLSMLVIIGIAVGMVLVILILAVLVVIICIVVSHRKRKQSYDMPNKQTDLRNGHHSSSNTEDIYSTPGVHYTHGEIVIDNTAVQTYCDPVDVIPTQPPLPKRGSSFGARRSLKSEGTLPSDTPSTFSQLPIYSEPFNIIKSSTSSLAQSNISPLLPDVIETSTTPKPRPYERVSLSKRSHSTCSTSSGDGLLTAESDPPTNTTLIYDTINEGDQP